MERPDHTPDTPDTPDTPVAAERRPLRRPVEGRMLAGVAAGAAEFLGVDVTLVRILIVALVLFGGAGIPLYLAAWLLVPEEGAEYAIADDLLHHAHLW